MRKLVMLIRVAVASFVAYMIAAIVTQKAMDDAIAALNELGNKYPSGDKTLKEIENDFLHSYNPRGQRNPNDRRNGRS